ncbi:MAG: DNA-3-methyladenine glycosylase I [Lachnospiraceae bacterium]
MKKRCSWAMQSDMEQEYHDHEWGRPEYDDAKLFELLILETMQAGLSWVLVLKKRENMERAFDSWDYQQIARYDEQKVTQLLNDEGIIRNRLKIRAAITNARAFMQVQQEYGSFSEYIWSFIERQPIVNHWKHKEEVPASTSLSDRISKDLKKKGFKFVGTIVVYSYMQAIGMVNDHTTDCFLRMEQ